MTSKSGKTVTGLLSHEDMEKAVGDAIAAFTHELLFQKSDRYNK